MGMPTQRTKARGLNSKPHVGIVGAGLSGLRCADILLQKGFKVTIIEGRDRIGGRLHQEKLPNGHWVDIGPNWIHGTKNNPMLDLAKETRTIAANLDATSYAFDESGTIFPLKESEKYAGIMWGIVEDAFKHSNKFSADIHQDESLLDFFKKRLEEIVPSNELDWERKRKIVLQISELWGAFVGSPVSRQSLKFFWLEECVEGENLFCAGTYKKILETIAKPALAGADINFETRAAKISYQSDSESKIKIFTEDGQTWSFDEIVVTSPLGWLKKNPQAFEPSLPTRLTKAIESISYGCLEKVYISFPRAFWLSAEGDDDKVEGFIQWLAPDYAPETNPEKWNQEAVELANLAPGAAHPTILFYIYGDGSKHLTSKVASLPSKKEKDDFLLAFFKPYYSRLPHYTETSVDCQPTNLMATDWLHDELAGYGSYSNFQVGLEAGGEDIETMRHGLPEEGLWFAGEHTAPFVGLGTATGAYWSGEAVGRRIAEAYGREKSE